MTKNSERRYVDRICIAGAEVLYKEIRTVSLFQKFSQPFPLVDLNKSGLSFEMDHQLHPGVLLNLKLVIPGEKKINLKGRLIWITKLEKEGNYRTGVQFLPFGKGRNYNTFGSHERLLQLTNKYKN